jgi:hypothetical protein
VQPAWLKEGANISVKRAPTRFGIVDFDLRRRGAELVLDYHRNATVNPERVRLHVPHGLEGIQTIRINGRSRALPPGESTVEVTEA